MLPALKEVARNNDFCELSSLKRYQKITIFTKYSAEINIANNTEN